MKNKVVIITILICILSIGFIGVIIMLRNDNDNVITAEPIPKKEVIGAQQIEVKTDASSAVSFEQKKNW